MIRNTSPSISLNPPLSVIHESYHGFRQPGELVALLGQSADGAGYGFQCGVESKALAERVTGHRDVYGLPVFAEDLRGVGPDGARTLRLADRCTPPASDDGGRGLEGHLGLIQRGVVEVLEHFKGAVHAGR